MIHHSLISATTWLFARKRRWLRRSAWVLGLAWATVMMAPHMEGCDARALHAGHRCPWPQHALFFIPSASADEEVPPPAFMQFRNRVFNDYRKCAATNQDGRCEYELGFAFESAPSENRNMGEALSYYRQAAKKGHVLASGRAGFFEVYGMAGRRNVPAGLLLLNSAADQGDFTAQLTLAEIYTKPQVPLPELAPDPWLGLGWSMQVALRGNALGAYRVAQSYANGGPFGRDTALAINFWTRAANAGHAQSWLELGKLFASGGSVPTDPALARALLVVGGEIGKTDFLQDPVARALPNLSAADKSRSDSLAAAMRQARAVSMIVSSAAISSFAKPAARSPNGLPQVDLAGHCKTAPTLPDSFPVLTRPGDPYAWKCVDQNGAYKVLVVPEICLLQKPAAVAVLENPTDARSWACLSAAANLPQRLVSADMPAAPLASPGDKIAAEWFEKHFMRVAPLPFHDANGAISRLRMGNDGSVTVQAWPLGWSLFGSNVLMLRASNLTTLKESGADRQLDRVMANLQDESPALSYEFSKHVLLLDYAPQEAGLARSLIGRGYSVWLSGTPGKVGSQPAKPSAFANTLLVLDKHSYTRAYTNPRITLQPSELPQRTTPWLMLALGSHTADTMPASLPLAEVLRRTSSAGKFAASLEALPAEITLPQSLQAEMRTLMIRQSKEGREIHGDLIAGADGVPVLNAEVLQQAGGYSRADGSYDFSRLLLALSAASATACSGESCDLLRQWNAQAIGGFHTHPEKPGFSSYDIRASADARNVALVTTPEGLQQMLVPTMASRGSTVGNYWANPVMPLRLTAAYLEPTATLGCQFNEQRELFTQATHAGALGMALYSGKNGVLRRVPVDAKVQAALRGGHPLDLLFDANGKLAAPVDRLRVAIVARRQRQANHLLDDLGPEDAFSPGLSAVTRSLLGGGVNRETVERAFQEHYAQSRKIAQGTPGLVGGAPGLYFAHDGMSWMDTVCNSGALWTFGAKEENANKFKLVRTEREAQLITPTGEFARQCGVALRIYEPIDADGNRLVRDYCDSGLARESILEKDEMIYDDTIRQIRPWK